MADQIELRDKQTGIEMGWHGKTNVVPEVTFENAFGWELERAPIYTTVMRNVKNKETGKVSKVPKRITVAGFSTFIASDDDLPIGQPMAETYFALENSRFWEITNNALAGIGAVIESAGTIMNRTRRFITIKLDQNPDFTVGKRVFKNRISFLDSIDGSTFFHGINTSICTVCANTFNATIVSKEGAFRFRMRHTQGMATKIEDMEKKIEGLVGVAAQFKAAMEMASEMEVNREQAKNIFAGWIGTSAKDGLSTRAKNQVARLVDLYQGGAGNRGETLADAVSAVTDFYSHESSGGEEKENFRLKQWNSSEFGQGAIAKADFFNTVFSVDQKTARVSGINLENMDALNKRGAIILPTLAPVGQN